MGWEWDYRVQKYYEVKHDATLTRDFYIGKTEVTQAQWKAVMGNNPSKFKGDNLPVEKVSWNDAMEFCEKLNSMGKAPRGWKFTLPTETQWEYAAFGGKNRRYGRYAGSDDVGEVAWYDGNSGGRTYRDGDRDFQGINCTEVVLSRTHLDSNPGRVNLS